MFNRYLRLWGLMPDGEPIITHTSQILPVITIADNVKAMLKLTADADEKIGCELMVWWNGSRNGNGSAKVLAHSEGALLLERATGTRTLPAMPKMGQDEKACQIICRVAKQLHMPQKWPPPTLPSLADWFRSLESAAEKYGGIMRDCAEVARKLLANPQDIVVLHGDLHHNNILDFGNSRWLAIDPKGLIGERGFDFANIFTNPDLADPNAAIATNPKIFAQRLSTISEHAKIDRQRLLMWIIAWCGLSSAWFLESGDHTLITKKVAEMAGNPP